MFHDINSLDQIFYINLSYRVDRKENILKELAKVGAHPSKISRIEAYHDPLHGDRGCAISHLKALQAAKKMGCKTALILEDDAAFSTEKGGVNAYLSQFNEISHWDVLMLGGNILQYKATAHPSIIQVLAAQLAHSYIVKEHYLPSLMGCFAFAIDKMKDQIFYSEMQGDAFFAIDHLWKVLQLQDKWYAGRRTIGYQIPSFSDIVHAHTKRYTPNVYE